jgi:LacI family transcriptional regulator
MPGTDTILDRDDQLRLCYRNAMVVTIRDVARHAGVSAMTVSRVLNGQPRVAEATRRRVEAAVAELSYVPNSLARGLSGRRSRTVGVIVPDIANSFFTLVVRGVEEAAWRAGMQVLLGNTHGDLEREGGHIEDLLSFRVEGVVIAPVSDRSSPQIARLVRDPVPFVLVDRAVPGRQADLVLGDSVAGARLLVEHLLSLGHRRIAIVTEPADVSTTRDRITGYRVALEAAGVAFDPGLVVEASAIEPGKTRAAALELLSRTVPPTAVFAINNVAAIGVAEAARELELAIPGQLSLVCFDDLVDASKLQPFLTVLAQPAETFGTIAMQLLLDRITGRVEEPPRTVILPGELVVRSSAAPPSARP